MHPNTGGVQRVSDILAKYFVRNGHKLFYLNLTRDEYDDYEYPAIRFFLPEADLFSTNNLKYYHNLLVSHSIDIVINHDASNERAKFFLNTGNIGVKKISVYHSDPLYGVNKIPSGNIGKLIYKTIPGLYFSLKKLKKRNEIKYLIKNSDNLVLLSEEFRKHIVSLLKINSPKLISISNPIQINNNGSLEFDKKKKQILFVGRLEFSPKRPEKLLKIWSKLEKKYPDWELIFLGDGPHGTELKEMAKSYHISHVKFEGFVDPKPYYEKASILCMTSDYEGFGLVLPEAMQFGVVPILFNNWNTIKDIIIDKETGILVKTDDIEEYVIKLEQLLSDEELRKRIAENAKVKSKSFDIEIIGEKWLDLFEKYERI